jgi:hypothetical protein
MRTSVIILVGALIAVVPLGSSFAQDETTNTEMDVVGNENMVRGRIETIDSVKNEVVIQTLSTGEEKTFTVTPDQIGTLMIGEKVRVKFNPETNVAESINSTVFKNGKWMLNDKETSQ